MSMMDALSALLAWSAPALELWGAGLLASTVLAAAVLAAAQVARLAR